MEPATDPSRNQLVDFADFSREAIEASERSPLVQLSKMMDQQRQRVEDIPNEQSKHTDT